MNGCARVGLSGGGGKVVGFGEGGNLKYEAGKVATLTRGTVSSRPSQSKIAVTDMTDATPSECAVVWFSQFLAADARGGLER